MGIERLNEFWPEWKIEKELGEGAYGKVYQAVRENHSLKSYAAIKIITIPQSKAEVSALRSEGMTEVEAKAYFDTIVSDFVNEIKLMEELKGVSNIVSVEDYRILEAKEGIGWDIFIRMELLTSFSDHISKNPMTEKDVIELGIDICSALEVCYKNHIIHRDIKPANIFISKLGGYKIGDFGVAKELEKTTGAMSAKGTYSYMAPEVAMGRRYDATVDIYSLGLVMYGLLNNNRQPFIDPSIQFVSYNDRKNANDRRLRGEKLPLPCDASPLLADIILTACAYDPQKRFSNPTAFKNILINCKNELIGSADVASKIKTDITNTVTPDSNGEETVAVIKPNTYVPPEDNDPQKKEKKKKSSAGTLITGILIWLIISAITVCGAIFFLNQSEEDDKSPSSADTEVSDTAADTEVNNVVQPQLSVGDIISLGSYEQDNDLTNGSEPIEWIVLDVQEDKALVLSKYGLDARGFFRWTYEEDPFIYDWLHDEFLPFSENELESIAKTTIHLEYNISNEDSEVLQVIDEENDELLLFPLSIEETEKYLSPEQRHCEVTEYAKVNGALADPYGWWWLRDEMGTNSIANVNGEGEIVTDAGQNIANKSACVRPAMWINLDEYYSY